MPTTLDQWQKRLEGHFRTLASSRSTADFPLFALEHGLDEEEIEDIGAQLRSRLAANMWLAGHWLCWVIYAAEFGYDYQGDEYWMSFESYTPGWREKVSRYQLRSWFQKFRTTFSGVNPCGLWADQFPIIAWPITHAILPKYLQWQLAKSLYELRYQISALDSLSAESIGHLLAQNTWDATSRLRGFLQQEELAGRIVLALLGDDASGAPSPIHPPTLSRLASDLQQVQSSREWLNETKRLVADRVEGTAPKSSHQPKDQGSGPERPKEKIRLGMRPILALRRSGSTSWSPVLDVPSFAAIARVRAELRMFLSRTRCRITGTGEGWRPTGWLLSHNQKCVLKKWPEAKALLLQFERDSPVLNHLIDEEMRLSSGPTWLCKLGGDGLAHEITSRVVRPQQTYIVLSEKPVTYDDFVRECQIDCEGVHGAVLTTPAQFDGNLIRRLHDLDLQVARTVRIWPAGLSARQWDGEGYSEWLTTETPCFGITHDHPVDGYVLRLDEGSECIIKAGVSGTPAFVSIGALLPGRHTLSVRARSIGSNQPRFPAPLEGKMILEVREPSAWIPGTTAHAGLAVSLEPLDTSLDSFWDGDAVLNILGPAGRQVTCDLTLSNTTGAQLLNERVAAFDLPVLDTQWQSKFSQFQVPDKRIFAYLEAVSGCLTVKGEELGEYTIRLEREIKPVRWICRSIQGVMTVRLNDDSGREDRAVAVFRSFLHPCRASALEGQAIDSGIEVPGTGGLFESRNGDFADVLVASTPRIDGGLRGLLVEPDLQDFANETAPLEQLMKLIGIWADARLVGPLVQLRHNRVLTRLVIALFSRVCGTRWAVAEAAYLSGTKSEVTLQQLQRVVGAPGFAAVLRRDYQQMQRGVSAGKAWFADVARRYATCNEAGLCEFALQLSSQPHRMLALPPPAFDTLLAEVRKNEALIRGARLVALLSAADNAAAVKPPLPRWTW